jgi:hypothetical protein
VRFFFIDSLGTEKCCTYNARVHPLFSCALHVSSILLPLYHIHQVANMHVAVDTHRKKAEYETAQAETPEFEYVKWWTDPGLRKLYCWAAVLCIASATTGYDGYNS